MKKIKLQLDEIHPHPTHGWGGTKYLSPDLQFNDDYDVVKLIRDKVCKDFTNIIFDNQCSDITLSHADRKNFHVTLGLPDGVYSTGITISKKYFSYMHIDISDVHYGAIAF